MPLQSALQTVAEMRRFFCAALFGRAALIPASLRVENSSMNRRLLLFFALGALCLAGCEQSKPPTPEGLRQIRLRTATGTLDTKLEARSQPSPARAGQISIWDFKVFDIHDKPDGARTEWKFFSALPQSSADQGTTDVLMNAWLVSKDKTVFLPQKPAYKQYGSFITDWTIPKSGPYTLWVEYQPVVAKDELSSDDLKGSKTLPIEHAHWDFSVAGQGNSPALAPQMAVGADLKSVTQSIYSLDRSDYGARAPFRLAVQSEAFRLERRTKFLPKIESAQGQISDQSLVALSPDGKTLVHEVGAAPSLILGQKGVWRAWFSFSLDGKPYAAPMDLSVS